jgi:hypothetical protein
LVAPPNAALPYLLRLATTTAVAVATPGPPVAAAAGGEHGDNLQRKRHESHEGLSSLHPAQAAAEQQWFRTNGTRVRAPALMLMLALQAKHCM